MIGAMAFWVVGIMAPGLLRIGESILIVLTLAACAAPVPVGIDDPYEATNRKTHESSKALDTAILRPISGADSTGGHWVAIGLSNFSDNLEGLGYASNDLLQAKPAQAIGNILRVAINSTLGIGGILDPAAAIGLAEAKNDFGHTLHVWGVGEGAYVELPLLGPSTERDTLGEIGDMVVDPTGLLLSTGQSAVKFAFRMAARVGDRGRFSETVDSILYDSADSYEQARLLYLQNRRYELGQSTGEAGFEDPYEDPYAE